MFTLALTRHESVKIESVAKKHEMEIRHQGHSLQRSAKPAG